MAYFDGCHFDPTYFDASECVVQELSGGGYSPIARTIQRQPVTRTVMPEVQEQEEQWVLGLISIGGDR
jgi:hypothetical protein